MHRMDAFISAQRPAAVNREGNGNPSIFRIDAEECGDRLVTHVPAQQPVVGVQHIRVEKRLAVHKPSSELVILAGTDHNLHLRRPVRAVRTAEADFETLLKLADLPQGGNVNEGHRSSRRGVPRCGARCSSDTATARVGSLGGGGGGGGGGSREVHRTLERSEEGQTAPILKSPRRDANDLNQSFHPDSVKGSNARSAQL